MVQLLFDEPKFMLQAEPLVLLPDPVLMNMRAFIF